MGTYGTPALRLAAAWRPSAKLAAVGHAWETRAKLLAAARRAFAELGYAKARVEDIVTRAGVGHGTFYAYFPNKQAALAALMREHAGALEELAGQPWRSGDVRASLAQVLGGLADRRLHRRRRPGGHGRADAVPARGTPRAAGAAAHRRHPRGPLVPRPLQSLTSGGSAPRLPPKTPGLTGSGRGVCNRCCGVAASC